MQRVPCGRGSLSDDALAGLERLGAVYLEGVGANGRLLELAEQLGEVIAPGTWSGNASGLHDGRVYSVEVRRGGEGEVDQHGNTVVSSTNREFTLHTDGYSRPEPPRYVLLLRTDDGPDDAVSYIGDSREALRELDPEALATLARPVFPSSVGPLALLEPAPDVGTRLRFNKTEVDRWAAVEAGDPPLGDGLRDAVTQLDRCLHAYQQTLTIGSADCLVLDNWRMCHGRSAMPPDSRRVLKRVWVA